MICFSDFLLARRPWSYCRLNEPAGHFIYCDISGNSNHLYPKRVDSEFVQAASNQIANSFEGDPGMLAIQPLLENQVLSLNQIDLEIPDTALQLAVSEFRSDTVHYRNHREKFQNPLKMREMWVDVLLDPHPTDHRALIEPILPPLFATTGTIAQVDRVVLDEDWGYAGMLSGEREFTGVSIKPIISRMFENFMVFGPMIFTAVTATHLDYDGAVSHSLTLKMFIRYVGANSEDSLYEVWTRTLVTADAQADPAQPFSNGMHRFSFGVEQVTAKSMIFRLSIDGAVATQTTIELDENDGSFFVLSDYPAYSKAAIFNQTKFSNLAVFYNSPFPSTQWLAASQVVLSNNRTGAVTEELAILNETPPINALPGTLLTALDTALLIGNQHLPIISAGLSGDLLTLSVSTDASAYSPSGAPIQNAYVLINDNTQGAFNGVWRVTGKTHSGVTLAPSTTTDLEGVIRFGGVDHSATRIRITSQSTLTITLPPNHGFVPGDLVSVGQFSATLLPHLWKVSSTDGNGFTLTLENDPVNAAMNSSAVIKKTPIGGGTGWAKTYRTGEAEYLCTITECVPKKMVVDDSQSKFAKVRLSSIDGTGLSEPVYFTRYSKNSANREPLRTPWKAAGNAGRIFLFLAAKQGLVSHAQLLAYGEIQSWADKGWGVILIGYASDSAEQNCGFSYAFAYPAWSILPTGHLLCQSIPTAQSDARWRHREENTDENIMGFADSGHHIYPIDIPYIAYTP